MRFRLPLRAWMGLVMSYDISHRLPVLTTK